MGGGWNCLWWWEGDSIEDDRRWWGEGHSKKKAKIVECRRKQGWQKKRVGKTIHYCDRYFTHFLFDTAVLPDIWEGYWKWWGWCLGDSIEDGRRWRSQGWCEGKSRHSQRFRLFQDQHYQDRCEDMDRKNMPNWNISVLKRVFDTERPLWRQFSWWGCRHWEARRNGRRKKKAKREATKADTQKKPMGYRHIELFFKT